MEWTFVLRLLLAGMLGAVIGLDREFRAKEAGFRTHFLVCLGSALFVIISIYAFTDYAKENGFNYDVSRVAAQIVSGIGFIGAGTIIFQKQMIKGLTTAAGMWATAAIGMSIGAGMYILGISATVLVLIGLELLSVIFKGIGLTTLSISLTTTDQNNLELILKEIELRKHHLVSYTTTTESHADVALYKVSFVVKTIGYPNSNSLIAFIQSLKGITQLNIE